MSPLQKAFREYTPRTVFVPLALIIVASLTAFFLYFRYSTGLGAKTYGNVFLISIMALILSAFMITYNATFLQFYRLKSWGFNFAIVLFVACMYFCFSALFSLSQSINNSNTLFHMAYASICLLFLSNLSEFNRLSKYIAIGIILFLFFGLTGEQFFLSTDMIDNFSWVRVFSDSRVLNIASFLCLSFTLIILFLSTNLLFEKFKEKK